MTREEFLSNHWRRYPAAQASWVDAAQDLTGAAGVCGRLARGEGDIWSLEAAGVGFEIVFADKCDWFDPQLNSSGEEAEFSPDLLAAGDLVCVRLEQQPGLSVRAVSACLLLAPARGDFRLRSEFDFAGSRRWGQFLTEVREFFRARDFVEARTPTLVPSPGTEPFLDPFSSVWEFGSERRTAYLPTSPEFHLKKMLVAGWTRVFECKTCFRNGEIGPHHQPEFLMLEWYRAYAPLAAIAEDVEGLLGWLAERLGPELTHGPPKLVRTTMSEVFATAFSGFRLRPDTTRDELVSLADREGVRVDATDSWDEVFFRLFLERIEGRLGQEAPTLLHGFPPSQAALSRIGPDGFADRFEIYWRGFEIANAFHELNDPEENERRFRADAEKKAALEKAPVPSDAELIRALYRGLPPSGGIALGLDRLFMALYGVEELQNTRAFPFDPGALPEKGR